MYKFLLILVLILTGCGGASVYQQPYAVTSISLPMSVQFSPTSEIKQPELLQQSIDFWNTGIGKTMFILSDTPEITIEADNREASVQYPPQGASHREEKNGIVVSCNIHLFSSSSPIILYAHEMGHCLGLEHTEDPESLMYGGVLFPEARITPEIEDVINNLS